MAFGLIEPGSKSLFIGNVWVDGWGSRVPVYSADHKLRCLSSVVYLVGQHKLLRVCGPVDVPHGHVRLRVLRPAVASVQHACDLRVAASLVVVEGAHVPGHPASVDQHRLRPVVAVEVGVERRHNIDTFLAILVAQDLHVSACVEHSCERDWAEGPLFLELVSVLSCPREGATVLGSDVDRGLIKTLLSVFKGVKTLALSTYLPWLVRILSKLLLP